MDNEHVLNALAQSIGWKTSSWTAEGQNCVEVTRTLATWVGIRDTKQRASGLLAFHERHWTTFIHAVSADTLDAQCGK